MPRNIVHNVTCEVKGGEESSHKSCLCSVILLNQKNTEGY